MAKRDEDNAVIGCLGMIVLLGLVVWFLLTMGGCYSSYSEGIRTGELVKFSRKGLVFKSWEGQIKISENSFWEFSATDPSIIDELNKSVGKNVDIGYHQWYSKPVYQDSEYTAQSTKVHSK